MIIWYEQQWTLEITRAYNYSSNHLHLLYASLMHQFLSVALYIPMSSRTVQEIHSLVIAEFCCNFVNYELYHAVTVHWILKFFSRRSLAIFNKTKLLVAALFDALTYGVIVFRKRSFNAHWILIVLDDSWCILVENYCVGITEY